MADFTRRKHKYVYVELSCRVVLLDKHAGQKPLISLTGIKLQAVSLRDCDCSFTGFLTLPKAIKHYSGLVFLPISKYLLAKFDGASFTAFLTLPKAMLKLSLV